MKQITEELLLELGWKKACFFYQIGGGEDESDIMILSNGSVSVTYSYHLKCWFKADNNRLSYVNGFPYDNAVHLIEEL